MYVNTSSIDEDDSGYHHHDQPDSNHPIGILGRTLFFLGIPLCILAVLANVLLIFVILSYKALKIRCNHYILNYAICNIGYLTADYILHLAMDLFYGGWLEIRWYCTFIQLENYFLNMSIIFIAAYTFDEYILLSSGDYFLFMYKNDYKYIIASIYPLHFIFAFVVSTVCFHSRQKVRFDSSFIVVTVIYIVLLIAISIIKYASKKNIRYKNNKQLNIALNVTLTVFLLFLPTIMFYNALDITETYTTISDETFNILLVVSFIPEYLAYITSPVIAYMLFKLNKYFRLAICKLFCKSTQNLDYSRLDIVPESDMKG